MKKIIPIILLIVSVLSCREPIDFELNGDGNSRLVICGGITTEAKSHTVTLTRTMSYYSPEAAPRETGAIVTISDGTNIFPLTESSFNPGLYKTDSTVYGEVNKTYTLKVTTKDGEIYEASSPLLRVAEIDSVSYKYNELFMYDKDRSNYELLLFSQEIPGIGDNYMSNIYLQNNSGEYVLDNDTLRETPFYQDQQFDGYYLPGLGFYNISAQTIKTDSVNVKVELLSLTLDYYEYNYAILMETDYRGSPFDGPAANIPTNISNGGLGYFWASASSTYFFTLYREH